MTPWSGFSKVVRRGVKNGDASPCYLGGLTLSYISYVLCVVHESSTVMSIRVPYVPLPLSLGPLQWGSRRLNLLPLIRGSSLS